MKKVLLGTFAGVLLTTVASAQVIVESRDSGGALTSSTLYEESGGGFADSSVKSSASGLSGTGSRWSGNGFIGDFADFKVGNDGGFSPDHYSVQSTVADTSSADAANTTYIVFDDANPLGSPIATGTANLTAAAAGDQWLTLEANAALGAGATVRIEEGSPQGSRMYADAVRIDVVANVDDWMLIDE